MESMNIMRYRARDKYEGTIEHYSGCKEALGNLFNHECCYCTINEGENKLGFFHVDHFRPKKHFTLLINEYDNLYYACHKCNVHKSDHWIARADGCIMDCNSCHTKVCNRKDVRRFIDPCAEDPNDFIEEDLETNHIIPKNTSQVGEYTIEMLRLNRNQLIRLRSSRRKLYMWLNYHLEKLDICERNLAQAKDQLSQLESIMEKHSIENHENKLLVQFALGFHIVMKQKITLLEREKEQAKLELRNVAGVVYEQKRPYEW